MQTGWQVIGNKKYYFNESSGIMLKNQWVGDSYLGNDGALISTKKIIVNGFKTVRVGGIDTKMEVIQPMTLK